MKFYRDTYAEIDLSQFEKNFNYIKQHIDKKLIAVIKANGYGHGATIIGKTAIKCGACMLAVSSLDEALTLRNDGIKEDIIVIGYTNIQDIEVAISNDIILTIPSLEYAMHVQDGKHRLRVHIKVDTAMNRLGMKTTTEVQQAVLALTQKNVIVEGIFTHYACSDIDDEEFTREQFEKFKMIVMHIKHNFKYIHASNSDAIMHFEEDFTNAARIGLGMYGISNFCNEVKPVLSLYTRLYNVKMVKAGEGIGYSQTYHAKNDEWIGTIPIGYADGFIRAYQGMNVFVDGKPCEIVGRICMDQCMIRLDKEYAENTLVEIIGKNQTCVELANYVNTIPYEVLCLISDRVPRIVKRNDEIVDIQTYRMH